MRCTAPTDACVLGSENPFLMPSPVLKAPMQAHLHRAIKIGGFT